MAKTTVDVWMAAPLDDTGGKFRLPYTLEGFDTLRRQEGVKFTDIYGTVYPPDPEKPDAPAFVLPALGITIDKSKGYDFLRLIMPMTPSIITMQDLKFLGVAILDDTSNRIGYREWNPPTFGTYFPDEKQKNIRVSTMTIELVNDLDSDSHSFSILWGRREPTGWSVQVFDPGIKNEEN